LRKDGLKVCLDEWALKAGDRIPARMGNPKCST
jgi:hypothetical protein